MQNLQKKKLGIQPTSCYPTSRFTNEKLLVYNLKGNWALVNSSESWWTTLSLVEFWWTLFNHIFEIGGD